jgi:hypothetical protein
MLITRTEMANAIAARKTAGVAVNVITNSESGNSTTVNDILSNSLTTHFTFDEVSSGILHHKYMIVDQYAAISDPMVFTGSHNWSAAADNDNDENTLVIHDATLANIFYQQFVKRFVDNMGVLFELTSPPTAVIDNVETVKDQMVNIPVLDNDIMQAPVTLSIEQQATSGVAALPFTNPITINYTPAPGFLGQDSIVYKIVYNAAPSLFASAKVYISVVEDNGINEFSRQNGLIISPNPAKDEINIQPSTSLNGVATLTVFDLMGNQQFEIKVEVNEPQIRFNSGSVGLKPGVYLVVLKDEKIMLTGRLVICK